MTEFVVIVPFRDKGDAARRRNLDTVIAHLDCLLPEATIRICTDGREGDAPFNRSAAYNRGVTAHFDADVYVFHEADMIVPRRQLLAAVDLAVAAPGLVVPFDVYHYLSPEGTDAVVAGRIDPFDLVAERRMTNGKSVGAVNVVSAKTMDAIGQWDEGFNGWGFDDKAMAFAFTRATGQRIRYVPGVACHLWHTPGWSARSRFAGGAASISPAEEAATEENERRYQRYRTALTPSEIRTLTAGG